MTLREYIEAKARLTDKELLDIQAERPVPAVEELANDWLNGRRLLADSATANAIRITAQQIIGRLKEMASSPDYSDLHRPIFRLLARMFEQELL